MNSEIVIGEAREVFHTVHKRNPVTKEFYTEKSKPVKIWRGMNRKLYKYILTNRYYPANILERNAEFKTLYDEKLSVVAA